MKGDLKTSTHTYKSSQLSTYSYSQKMYPTYLPQNYNKYDRPKIYHHMAYTLH